MATAKRVVCSENSELNGKRFTKGLKEKKFKEMKNKWENDRNEIKKLAEQRQEVLDSSKIEKFYDLPISRRTLIGLKHANYEIPTQIQKESLVLALRGFDILGAAKTGSGKTLCFLIPILETLYQNEWTRFDGLGALIITPVRELAYQIFNVLTKIGKKYEFSAGLIIGGKDLKFERSRLETCNIIICTPGRLLQHMDENPLLNCTNLKILVLDEADRMLDMGFASTMDAIIVNLPSERQTLLFSATQTKSVKDLARLSLRDPMYVSVHEHSKHSTPEGLQQSYIVCELHDKLNILWAFIKHHLKQKILVFMSSCKQVKFAYEAFCHMRPGTQLMSLYGTLHQERRMTIYNEFHERIRNTGKVLIATDIAARGLDFPDVDWVIQVDCPEDANTYIHRAGRTARYTEGGESLLFLMPSEEETMIEKLNEKRIPITKIRVHPKFLNCSIQRKLEAILVKYPSLKDTAQRAFSSYLKWVFLMKDKKVFDVTKLDLNAFASSLGLAVPPRVRFIEKRLKMQNKSNNKNAVSESIENVEQKSEDSDSANEPVKSAGKDQEVSNFGYDLSDDDEGLFTVKRVLKPSDIPDIEDEEEPTVKNAKTITKASVVKKILKKQIKPNTKMSFDDDGNIIEDERKGQTSQLAKVKDDDEGGINIEKSQQIMKEEDKIDKQLYRQRIKLMHKEKRLKEKELKNRHKSQALKEKNNDEEAENSSSDELGSVDLDFLPDPDKVYGKAEDSDKDDEDSEESDGSDDDVNSTSSSEDEGINTETTSKRKLRDQNSKNTKKRRMSSEAADDEQQHPLNTGLSLKDDEELALHLLTSNSL